MNENGYDNNQQYNNGYNQQYSSQQYNNGYNQQYSGQQYNNGYDQQFNNGYNSTPQVQVNLPEGLASHLPESWKNSIEDTLTEAARNAQNPYEQIVARESRSFIRPAFAIIAMVVLFAGCFSLQGNAGLFVFSIGVMCILIGLGIITDQRNSFKKHTKSCVWVIFGVEVILASGYQLLAGSIPSLQAMDSRVKGMASGIIIGSIGPLLLIFHFLNFYFRKKTCTQEVQAVCVYLQQRWSKNSNGNPHIVYIPIYEFTFRGNQYCVAGSSNKQITVSSTFMGRREEKYYNVPVVGEQYDLMVNPNDPAEFYPKKEAPSISVWVLAIVIIAIGYRLFHSTVN